MSASGPGRGACRVAGAGVRGDLRCPDWRKAGSHPHSPPPQAPPQGSSLPPPWNWASPWSDPGDARPTRRRSGDRTGGSPCRWLRGTRAAEASTLPAQALRTSAKPLLRSRGHRRGVPSGGGGGDIIHLTRLPAEIRPGKGAMPWAGCPPGGGAAGSGVRETRLGRGWGRPAGPQCQMLGGDRGPQQVGGLPGNPTSAVSAPTCPGCFRIAPRSPGGMASCRHRKEEMSPGDCKHGDTSVQVVKGLFPE